MVVMARRSFGIIRTDRDLYRHGPFVGPEYRIVARLRKMYPAGTAVSLPIHDKRITNVAQRLRLVLYPPFQLRRDSELMILAKDRVKPGDRILERGRLLVLVRRQPGRSE